MVFLVTVFSFSLTYNSLEPKSPFSNCLLTFSLARESKNFLISSTVEFSRAITASRTASLFDSDENRAQIASDVYDGTNSNNDDTVIDKKVPSQINGQNHTQKSDYDGSDGNDDTLHTLPGEQQNEHDPYWIESIGLWGCKNCNLKTDKFGMKNVACKRYKKK